MPQAVKNRKERRKELVPDRLHVKFMYKEKDELQVTIKQKEDGRNVAYVRVEGLASTNAKDGSRDIVLQDGIDISRFEYGNAPLKSMHGRTVLSNVGVIQTAKKVKYNDVVGQFPHRRNKIDKDFEGMYIEGEARLDITKDNNGRPINMEDYVLYDRLMNRTINGFSVGFHNVKRYYDSERDATIIESMTLHEVSLVDVPDNPLTITKLLDLQDESSSSDVLSSTNDTMPKTGAKNQATEKELTDEQLAEQEKQAKEKSIEQAKQIEEQDEKYGEDEIIDADVENVEASDEKGVEGEDEEADEQTNEEEEKDVNVDENETEETEVTDEDDAEKNHEDEQTNEDEVTEIDGKSIVHAYAIKETDNVELKSLALNKLKVGKMYRYKRELSHPIFGNISYVYNAELIKMDYEDEKASEDNPMVYFLDYTLDINGFKATTTVEKALFDQFELVTLSEDQLKELLVAEHKEWQDSKDSGNADAKDVSENDTKSEEADKGLETQAEEVKQLSEQVKELEGQLKEKNEMLSEAQDIAQKAIEAYNAVKKELDRVAKKKLSHGLKAMGTEPEEEAGQPKKLQNVSDAIKAGFKQ